MNQLQIQLARIKRRAWLVILVAVLAVAGAAAMSLTQPTTYTGTATLSIASENRAPEQDAVLAQGYTDYFNQEAYQNVLRERAGLPENVTFSARTAAASPIVYIEATATNPTDAGTAAGQIASEFRDDINENLRADKERTVTQLREQVVAESGRLQLLDLPADERSLIAENIRSLQNRITELQSDTSNQLKELQLNAGVSTNAPKPVLNALLALVGGTILGTIAALTLASFEKRQATADNVRELLGLDTIATIRGSSTTAGPDNSTERLKGLANVVGLSRLSRPTTIAVTAPRPIGSHSVIDLVARHLASYRALQGERTILVQADLHRASQGEAGVANLLENSSTTNLDGMLQQGWRNGLLVVPPGVSRQDAFALVTRERFGKLLEKFTGISDLVVIESPPLIEAAEAQVICAAADRTILVLAENATDISDAAQAIELLEQANATLLGVVLIDPALSLDSSTLPHSQDGLPGYPGAFAPDYYPVTPASPPLQRKAWP